MFVFLLGCVVVFYYIDKIYIKNKKKTVEKSVFEGNEVIIEENDNKTTEILTSLGFVEKDDLEKLKKQWKNIIYFKIPLFIVISLFVFPGALLFVPVYFAINYVIIKIRINYLERRKK